MKRLTTVAQAFAKAGWKLNRNDRLMKTSRFTVSMESNYALSYKTAQSLRNQGIIA